LLETPGGAPRLGERGERKHERGASDEPEGRESQDGPSLTLSKEIRGVRSRVTILAAPKPERRKTVLIVDDDEGMRDTLSAVLRETSACEGGDREAALQIMEKEE